MILYNHTFNRSGLYMTPGSGAENRTQTSGFRDPRTNQYTTPQYQQGTIKNNNGALPTELLPYIGRGGRDSNPRHPAWKANF